jgi:hypothetical protein
MTAAFSLPSEPLHQLASIRTNFTRWQAAFSFALHVGLHLCHRTCHINCSIELRNLTREPLRAPRAKTCQGICAQKNAKELVTGLKIDIITASINHLLIQSKMLCLS